MIGLPLVLENSTICIPDSVSLPEALGRITHLGVGAHQDDLEFMAFHGIAECYESDGLWFGGVTCTDGKGSSRNSAYANLSSNELGALRRQEQDEAAKIGRFGIMIQLGYSSFEATDPQSDLLPNDLFQILSATRPQVVYTHSPADKHRTHLGVFAALLQALRRMPAVDRPSKLIGCEGWRDLDWLCDREKVRMDVSEHADLAEKLNSVFASQIAGGKRYDLAVTGRRAANATFYEPREGDHASQVLTGIDLTPLIVEESIDVIDFTRGFIRRFENEVVNGLAPYFKK
jgi:LmbE family N-acetylglucosaminyl deacetylase